MSITRFQLVAAIVAATLVGGATVFVIGFVLGGRSDGGALRAGASATTPSDGSAGLLVDPSMTTSPSGSPSTKPSPSPSPSASSSGWAPAASPTLPVRPPGAAGTPGGIINLANWKLTLPIAKSGSTKAMEILQPQLSSYVNAPYFTTTGSGDGVVFQAAAGGATTSGSGYPRSELREMTGNGSQEAGWSSSSGTHIMTVREAVTHLTTVKPQVTVAQIHDSSDDVIVIRLDGPHHLYAEHNGQNYGDIDNNYSLGTVFSAQIAVSGGHVRITYNGALKVDVPVSGSGNYFKAGCYTQSNADKGDEPTAYAQVVIYRLEVSHT
jgi:poly(beta-D-mannuronate) lyase